MRVFMPRLEDSREEGHEITWGVVGDGLLGAVLIFGRGDPVCASELLWYRV